MKYIVLIVSFLIISILGFSQEDEVSRNPNVKWRQQRVRVNLSVLPQVEYVKIASKMDLNISVSGLMTFNNKIFFGGYFSKKPLKRCSSISCF